MVQGWDCRLHGYHNAVIPHPDNRKLAPIAIHKSLELVWADCFENIHVASSLFGVFDISFAGLALRLRFLG